MNLNNIINEEIQRLINDITYTDVLNESLSSKLYHFCDLDALYGIIKNNSFLLTSSYSNKSDYKMSSIGSKLYPYYLCFSRTSNAKSGYVRQRFLNSSSWRKCLCRIHVDGDKLNIKGYKGRAVSAIDDKSPSDDKFTVKKDYVHNSGFDPILGGKNSLYNGGKNSMKSFKDDNGNYKDIAFDTKQELSEYEDRLLSNNSILPNASKYITQIDILVPKTLINSNAKSNEGTIKKIQDILKNSDYINGSRVFIFDNFEAFNNPKASINAGLTINEKFNISTDSSNSFVEMTKTQLIPFAAGLYLILYEESNSEIEMILNAKKLIGLYKLDNYKNEIINILNNKFIKNEDIDVSGANYIYKRISSIKGDNWIYQNLMKEMMKDYTSIYNVEPSCIGTLKSNMEKNSGKYINNILKSKKGGLFRKFLNGEFVGEIVGKLYNKLEERLGDIHKEEFTKDGIEKRKIEMSKIHDNEKINQRMKVSSYYEPESIEYNLSSMRSKRNGKRNKDELLSDLRNKYKGNYTPKIKNTVSNEINNAEVNNGLTTNINDTAFKINNSTYKSKASKEKNSNEAYRLVANSSKRIWLTNIMANIMKNAIKSGAPKDEAELKNLFNACFLIDNKSYPMPSKNVFNSLKVKFGIE